MAHMVQKEELHKKNLFLPFLLKKCLLFKLWATITPKTCMSSTNVLVYDNALCMNCVYVLLLY